MYVYIITEHVEWEGYSIVGVYSSEAEARNEVWKYVERNLAYNEEDGNVVQTVGYHETSPIFTMGQSDARGFIHRDGVEQWYRIRAFYVHGKD
jgi:hypothetical protein